MTEDKLFETVANLVLQSISIWEDMHLYALTYSTEYNAFWGLLDNNLNTTVCRYRKRNREERLVPFTMSLASYYRNIMTPENYMKIKDQHWKKQLKIILTDKKFRLVMTQLNQKIKNGHEGDYRYIEHRAAVNDGIMRAM